jgi:hypothetical protein
VGVKFLATVWICCALTSSAVGCITADSFSTVFFKSPPDQISDPVVAMISITRIIDQPTSRDRHDMSISVGSYLAEAKVLEVLKGDVPQTSIFVVAGGSDCSDVLREGASGIVAGRFRVNPQGERQLFLQPHRVNPRR